MTPHTHPLVVVSLLALAAVLGCGGQGITPPKTQPVSGTVVHKGKPAAGFRVTFHPQFDIGKVKYTPAGETDKDGKFTLSTGAANNGAPPGEYVVTFEKPRTDSDPKSGLEIEVDDLKGKYSDPAASAVRVTVQRGENAVGPFNLD